MSAGGHGLSGVERRGLKVIEGQRHRADLQLRHAARIRPLSQQPDARGRAHRQDQRDHQDQRLRAHSVHENPQVSSTAARPN